MAILWYFVITMATHSLLARGESQTSSVTTVGLEDGMTTTMRPTADNHATVTNEELEMTRGDQRSSLTTEPQTTTGLQLV